VPSARVTRVVVPGGGGVVAGAGVAVGGSAVTVAVLVGFASSPVTLGQSWTTIQAMRITPATRSSRRRTYTERSCGLLTTPR
jgi:hypothetical protein